MLGKTKISKPEITMYATRRDFCRIFKENMDGLYLLAFLLTADHAMAEKCFVRGLRGSAKSNAVFKEWAESWARRTIIRKAIQMVKPRQSGNQDISGEPIRFAGRSAGELPEVRAIAGVSAFERFVFVMSVLERYSDRDTALLLNCSRADVIAARTQAVQQIGASAELRQKLESITGGDDPLKAPHGPDFRMAAISA